MGFRARIAGNGAAALGTLLGVLSLSLIAVAPASGDDSAVGKKIVNSINLVEADLRSAIRLLMQQTGAEIVIEHSDKPYSTVSLTLDRKPLVTVLNAMCRSAGASLREENGVYYVGPRGAEPVKPVVKEPVVDPIREPVKPLRVRREKIFLRHSNPSEVVNYLKQTSVPDPLLRRLLASGVQATTPFAKMDNLKSSPLQSLNPVYAPPVVPTSQEPESGLPDEARQFGGGGGFGGGGQGGGGGGFGGGGQGGGLGNLIPDGVVDILAYDLDNTIIFSYETEQGKQDLLEIIRFLDVRPRQLMIKAEFVQVSQNDLKQFGIDWQLARGNLTAGNPGFAAGQVFMNYATGNIAAQLRTSLTEGKGRLISSPMVTTLNNVPVTVSVGRQIPVFITSAVAAGNGTVVLQTTLIPIFAQTGMAVQARINGDDSISISILPFVNDVAGQVTGPDGQTAPIISQQIVGPISRIIGNGDTMVIAGLVTKNDGTSTKKVPLLGDLPFIGQLFRATEYRVEDTELLVFVTPSIIPERTGSGAAGATQISPR